MSLHESNAPSPFAAVSGGPLVPTLTLSDAAAAAAKPKKNRCAAPNCSRRLALTDFDCRCGTRYCAEHRVPESHACTYDFRAAAAATLTTQLTRVVGNKLERF